MKKREKIRYKGGPMAGTKTKYEVIGKNPEFRLAT